MEGDSSLSVGQARRVESRQDWEMGKWGEGGKETSRPGQIERGRRGAGGQAQASEEGVWSGQWAGM